MKKSRKSYYKNYRLTHLSRDFKKDPSKPKELPSRVPDRYIVRPDDTHEEQLRKNSCYKAWCYRTGVLYRTEDINYTATRAKYTRKPKEQHLDLRTLSGLEEERDRLVQERLQTTDSDKWNDLTSRINNIMVKLHTKKQNRK